MFLARARLYITTNYSIDFVRRFERGLLPRDAVRTSGPVNDVPELGHIPEPQIKYKHDRD